MKFGYWTVVGSLTNKGKCKAYPCRCICGKEGLVNKSNLLSGQSTNCGCKRINSLKKHGKYRSPEYAIWSAMRTRCLSPNHKQWHRYGGRGIKVCERWLKSFANFIQDMGERPSDQYTLERVDNNGNYEPQNCLWVTREQQSNNMARNRLITIDGETHNTTQWAKIVGLNRGTINYRLCMGWPEREAILLPKGSKKPNAS